MVYSMAKFSDSIKNAMQTALETIARKAYNESAANIPSYNRNQQQAILSSRYITTTSDRVEYGFTKNGPNRKKIDTTY